MIEDVKALVVLAAVGVSTAVAVSVVGLPISSTPTAIAVEAAPPAAAESTTTTVTAPAPVPPAPAAPSTVPLAPGAHGPEVVGLQERLVQLHYDPGTVDGHYGDTTALAVMAFQKVGGLGRTGVADPATLAALAGAIDPAPLVPDDAPTRVEVDMGRQVLLVWTDGRLVRILPVSTGSGKRYCENGNCGVAVTPLGEFRAERRIPGLHRSPLGILYNPVFFHQGFAIHGSPSMPPYPASHGCVRVPIHSSRWIYDHVPDGTPIHVI